MSRLPGHAWRVVILLIAGLLALLIARASFTPETFGEIGHYRAAAVDLNSNKEIHYAGLATCSICHDDVADTHLHPYGDPVRDPRTGDVLRCTSCHAPHSSEHEGLTTHEKDRALCIQCHVGPNLEVRSTTTR